MRRRAVSGLWNATHGSGVLLTVTKLPGSGSFIGNLILLLPSMGRLGNGCFVFSSLFTQTCRQGTERMLLCVLKAHLEERRMEVWVKASVLLVLVLSGDCQNGRNKIFKDMIIFHRGLRKFP